MMDLDSNRFDKCTLGDCIYMYIYKGKNTIVSNGKVVDFENEKSTATTANHARC